MFTGSPRRTEVHVSGQIMFMSNEKRSTVHHRRPHGQLPTFLDGQVPAFLEDEVPAFLEARN